MRRPFFKGFRRKRDPSDPSNARTNERIRVPQIRVIDNEGKQLGIMSPAEAMKIAQAKDLDLVEVSPVAKPPVCKIIDFGSYKYQKMKENQRKKKTQKKLELKGIQLSVRTAEHDLKFKAKQTDKFLDKGHPVRIEIRLRGREKANKGFALEKLESFMKEYIRSDYRVEQEPKRSGFGFNTIIRKKT